MFEVWEGDSRKSFFEYPQFPLKTECLGSKTKNSETPSTRLGEVSLQTLIQTAKDISLVTIKTYEVF